MEIVLIRHGESEANRINREEYPLFCGRWDCELTEKGRKQAESLKNDPAVSGADALYSSPLKRARETAESFWDKEIIFDDRLVERTLGVFDGRRISDVENDPLYAKYFTDPEYSNFRSGFTARAPGGENYGDVEKRVSSFINDVMKKGYSKIVVVSHVCVVRCFLKILKGLTEEETPSLRIVQCEPVILTV